MVTTLLLAVSIAVAQVAHAHAHSHGPVQQVDQMGPHFFMGPMMGHHRAVSVFPTFNAGNTSTTFDSFSSSPPSFFGPALAPAPAPAPAPQPLSPPQPSASRPSAEPAFSPAFASPTQSPFHPMHNLQENKYSPFQPRFGVEREEATEEEWRNEISDELSTSGLMPGLIRKLPEGVVNIKYGMHSCVHMGTMLDSETSAYEPTSISYPADENKKYTLLMLDADNGNYVHWLLVNVPGYNIDAGATISEYNSPVPPLGSRPHRYVFLAMEQTLGQMAVTGFAGHLSKACQDRGRANLDVNGFRRFFALDEPIAVNYFSVEHDAFVDSIVQYCADKMGA